MEEQLFASASASHRVSQALACLASLCPVSEVYSSGGGPQQGGQLLRAASVSRLLFFSPWVDRALASDVTFLLAAPALG